MAIRLLISWFSNCLALLVAAAVIPAIGYSEDFGTLLLAGLILAIVNFIVRPWIILFTLPAVILSFGLALLAINALMLWLTSRIVDGFARRRLLVDGRRRVDRVDRQRALKRLQRRPRDDEVPVGWERW